MQSNTHYLQPVIMPPQRAQQQQMQMSSHQQQQQGTMMDPLVQQHSHQAEMQRAPPTMQQMQQQVPMQQVQAQQVQSQQGQQQVPAQQPRQTQGPMPSAQQVQPGQGPMAVPISRPSISNADFQAFAKQHRPPDHVSLGGLPYRSASLFSTTGAAPSATGTGGTQLSISQKAHLTHTSVSLQEIVHPLTIGLSVAALSSIIFIASPGIAFTRVQDLDNPTERSRDWFKIAFVSTLVGAGTGIGLALSRRFM